MIDLKATLQSSLFFTDLQKRLQAAKTERELSAVAMEMDRAEFDALPSAARLDLAALYAHRLYHITGALLG